MRASVVSILVAGGTLALGACSPTVGSTNLTMAEQVERCRGIGAVMVSTGRETGDAGQDYRCRGGRGVPRGDTGVATGSLSSAVDRSLRRGN
jgi:hypothetical protein